MDNASEFEIFNSSLYQILLQIAGESKLADHMVYGFRNEPEIFGNHEDINQFLGFFINETAELSIDDNKSGIFSPTFNGSQNFEDEITDYTKGVNSLNFRSPEFVDNPEIIFSGCSVSYGVGIPADATWIEDLSKRLNPKSYVALAKPGSSSQKIVFTIFKYIFKYGKPKKIFVLFPDPFRMSSIVDSTNVTERDKKDGKGTYPVEIHLTRGKENLKKYSKRSHLLKEILIPEMGFRSTIESIYILEVFCREAGIDLIWSSWDVQTATIASLINFSTENKIFPNFSFNIYKQFYYSSLKEHVDDVECKPEIYKKYKDQYFRGTDKSRYHGCHVHSHIADGFIEEIKKRGAKN